MSDGRQKPYLVRAVGHALDVLEALSGGTGERSLTELSQATGLGPSTVHRLLSTLQARGFVRQDADNRRYRLGVRAIAVGASALGQLGIREAARSHLERLARETGQTVNLSILEGGELVYVDHLACRDAPVQIFSRIGGHSPLHCSASGRILLAYQPARSVAEAVERGLPAFTPRTLTELPELQEALAQDQARGYALCLAEWKDEVSSLAAPVREFSGQVIAAAGIVGLTSTFSAESIPVMAAQVLAAARAISAELGYRGDSHDSLDHDVGREADQEIASP